MSLHPVDAVSKADSLTGLAGGLPKETGEAPGPLSSAGPTAAAAPCRARSALIAALLDRSAQAFAAVDFDGHFTALNAAFAAMTGYAPEELARLSIADITPAAWHSAGRETLATLRATGVSARYEKEYRAKDGRIVPVSVSVDLDRDEADLPVGFIAFIEDISARKSAEAELRESEERFRSLYDEAPVGYHEIDLQGRIVRINRTECELLGYQREEILGRHVAEFLAEEIREEARRVISEKLRETRPLTTIERTFVTRTGDRLIFAIEERYSRDPEGHITGLRGTLQDVTARKRAEEALIASERRARALFDGIEDAIFVHSADGRILDANPAASRLLGYSHDELLAMTTREIDEPEFAAGFEERLRLQLREGHLACEGRHRTKDGRVIPVEITTSTIHFDHGRAVLAVIRDVTERKALEQTRRDFAESQLRNAREMAAKNLELTISEARYRQLTEGCLDAVVVADATGRITLFNPAAERTFGYAAAEVVGRPISVLMPDSSQEPHRAGFERYLRTRDPEVVGKTVELRGRRSDGEEFPLELSLSAVESAGELQFIGSIRDQTERQRMRAMLMQTDKLASIGLLSAGVAHEINNPLSYVGNNLAVLERDLKGVIALVGHYEEAREALGGAAPEALHQADEVSEEIDWPYIRDNIEHMLARTREGVQRVAVIVQNLRGLARTSPPRLEPASLPDMLEGALEMIRGRLRRNDIEVEVTHGDVPRLRCVPSQISQVILNLLINAVQAIEASGRPGGRIRFATARRGDWVEVDIEDNGCGIPAENLPRLFDPFFTTKSVGEGTGLGLSITHGIVTGHGGRIEVESRPDEGTRFRLVLPLVPA